MHTPFKRSLLALAITGSQCLLLGNALADEAARLDKMVVSAAGYEQKITDAPASISVITSEDLQKKPYANLLDAVKDIEGVDIGETTDKSGQGTVSIRGMGADYTLVLSDGKRQNNNGDIYPNGFCGLQFANIPPLSMVERIEVIRGPMSTLYGADAMGGVINIITKKVSNEWTGSIALSRTFQSDNAWGNKSTTDLAVMGPLIKDRLGLSLRGSYYDNNKSSPEWDKDSFNGQDSSKNNDSFGGNGKTMDNQNWAFGAGLTFTPNRMHTIRADFDVAKQKYDNSEGSVGTVDSYETIYDSQQVGYAETQRMEREQYSLSWEADWDVGKSTLGVHHIESRNLGRSLPLDAEQRKFIDDNKGTAWASIDVAMNDPLFLALMPRPTRTLESSNTVYSAKYELPVSEHYLVTGAEFQDSELKDGVFGMERGGKGNKAKKYYQYSVFAEDSLSITDPLTLTFGARYDKHEDFGEHVSPRAYATYAFTDSWTVKGGVATGYKTPQATDLYDGITGFGGQGTSPMVGNSELKPEKSISYELAAYYEHLDGHNFNVTVFQNDFKDKIESSSDVKGDIGQEWKDLGYEPTQKQNVGKATIRGIELAGRYYLLDSLSLKANWTYLDSEIKSSEPEQKGKPLRSSPKHMYNATLDWQATSRFNTYVQYQGELDRFNVRYQDLNGNYQDLYYKDYSVWNLGASFKMDERLTINARINNLFDKDFMKYNAVAQGSGRTPWHYEQYSNITPGRNFWVGMNYSF